MAKISLSGDEKSIESILQWRNNQRMALKYLQSKVLEAIVDQVRKAEISENFLMLTEKEIEAYFEDSGRELDHLVCFDLISAAEASIRVDFYNKVINKSKSVSGILFRELYKQKGNKTSLEEGIVQSWKKISNSNKIFGDFLSLLKYRHWLAHGRYWTPKFGRQYTSDIVFDILEELLFTIAQINQN